MSKTEEDPSVMQDFSGGLNTLVSPNRLAPTFTPSAINVWYDDGAIVQRPGKTQTNSGSILSRTFSGYSMHDSVFSGAEQLVIYGSAGLGANFLCYSNSGTDLNICTTATTGTASCPASTAVTGVGTNWLTGGTYGVGTAAPGALFISGATVGVIQSVNSDTSITLTGSFGTTISGSSYQITNSWPSSYRVSFADLQGQCWINGWGGAPVAWNGSVLSFINPLPIGTIATSTSSPTVTGSGTKFTCISATAIKLGAATIATSDGSVGVILSVASDTALTLTANYATNNSVASYTLPNFPQAAYSLAFSNYLFTGDTLSNPSREQWSYLLNPAIWPPANFVNVNPNDGFPMVGNFYDGQSLCMFKSNSMWKLSGTVFDPSNPTYTLTQVYTPSDFFINSPKTVQLYQESGFIMLGKKGFYLYNGAGAVSKMFNFDIVRANFSTIAAFNWGNVPAVTAEPSSLIVDGSYWVQVPYTLSTVDSAHKELTYVIDKNGAIWEWRSTSDGVNTNAKGMLSDFCYFQGNLYGVNSVANGTAGILQISNVNYDGSSTAIATQFNTKLIEFENQHRFGLGYIYYKIQTPPTPTGTVGTSTASPTVSGSGTNFLSIFVPGATITIGAVTGIVLTVNSNTSLTLTGNFGANNSTASYTVAGGDLINFSYSINGGSYINVQIDQTTGASGFGTTGKSDSILIGQVGRTIQFQVYNNIPGQSFEVYGIEFDSQELRQ